MSDVAKPPKMSKELKRLWKTIEARKDADPDSSYTAQLLSGGPHKPAKKLGEEAVEAAIAAVIGDKVELTKEAADVLYHLYVTLAVAGIHPNDVAAELAARTGQSGLEEKASRKKS